MLIATLRRAHALLLQLRFETTQQDSLLRHIAETELQADMREQASQGRDEGVLDLRNLAAALRRRAGLPPAECSGATGIGGAPLGAAARPAPSAPPPPPPFPLEETFAAGRKQAAGALAFWAEAHPAHREDIRQQLQAALERLDLGPFLAVYGGAAPANTLAEPLLAWDEALGRLIQLDASEMPAEVFQALSAGVEKLVAVRGEIKRRAKAAAARP